MIIPHLNVSLIQAHANQQSFERGKDYYQDGAVSRIVKRGDVVYADVAGSEMEDYQIGIELNPQGIRSADCSCPYSYDGWCKHIVATLLTCLYQPECVTTAPSLQKLLAKLTLEHMQALVQYLVLQDPHLLDAVDHYVSKQGLKKTRSKKHPAFDPKPVHRQIKNIVYEAIRDSHNGEEEDDLSASIYALLEQVLDLLDDQQIDKAILTLQAIIEGCIAHWDKIEEMVGLAPLDYGLDFDEAWAEVLLSAELTAEDVTHWRNQLKIWESFNGEFKLALAALSQGWHDPQINSILRGEHVEWDMLKTLAPDMPTKLHKFRLNVLFRQQRYDEALHFAKASGQTTEYLILLIHLGRYDEVTAVARQRPLCSTDAESLAKSLESQNQHEPALEIAMRSLERPLAAGYQSHEFAHWAYQYAIRLQKHDIALKALVIAFESKPSLDDYQTIQALAGQEWEHLRPRLLKCLHDVKTWGIADAQVDIFLHEGLTEDAMAVVSSQPSWSYSYGDGDHRLMLQVMDSVISTHSAWVIDQARPKAESIMDAGKAKYYEDAVKLLQRIKAAYQALDQDATWQSYYQQLRDTHARKYKLIGLMQKHLV